MSDLPPLPNPTLPVIPPQPDMGIPPMTPPPPVMPELPQPQPKIVPVPVPVPTMAKPKKPKSVITPQDIAKAQASYKKPDPTQGAGPSVAPLKPGWGGGA